MNPRAPVNGEVASVASQRTAAVRRADRAAIRGGDGDGVGDGQGAQIGRTGRSTQVQGRSPTVTKHGPAMRYGSMLNRKSVLSWAGGSTRRSAAEPGSFAVVVVPVGEVASGCVRQIAGG